MTADLWTIPSGGTLYAGCNPPPSGVQAWIPPSGYFADIPMLNYAYDVGPPIYPAGSAYTAFEFWTGSAVLYDFSPLGAQIFQGGGHESAATAPNIQMTVALDFSTLRWTTQNVPAAANPANTFDTVTGHAPDGTPYNGHTYLGLQEKPAAWGGGPKGTLVQMLTGGSVYRQKIHLIDVSQAIHGYTEMTLGGFHGPDNDIFFNASSVGGSYPFSAQDNVRQGWWLGVAANVSYILFVSKTGVITQYPAMPGEPFWPSLVFADSLDLLIMVNGGYNITDARAMTIRNLATGVTNKVNMIGNPPGFNSGNGQYRPEICGFQWVEELGCIVGLDCMELPMKMTKITPPVSNPDTMPWTCEVIPMAHWAAGDPTGSSTIRFAINGNFSKFRWVKTLQAFVLATSSYDKPQVFKL